MSRDIEKQLGALVDLHFKTRLSAAAALEQALKAEVAAGRHEWDPLVALALSHLITGLGDVYKGVQVHCANCLEVLSHQSSEVVPALRKVMVGTDAKRSWGAALVAARLGKWYPELGVALRAAMGSEDQDVRWAASGYGLALGRSHPEAVSMVKETLSGANPIARRMAAYCLGSVGAYADVEATLAARLGDPDRNVRRAVVVALDKIPHVSLPVQQQVAAMSSDPDLYVGRTATAVAARFTQG